MFNSKSKNAIDDTPSGGTTVVSAGATVTGNIASNGDIRIDGTVSGNIDAKGKVLIGPEGQVQGDIKAAQTDILGKVTGIINVTDLLQLRSKAIVNGDIYAAKLQIEPTVTFNGQCHMGANVVAINVEKPLAVNQ
jgi:cytoskeletal protein CcmA (bactofilin family)